MSDSSSIQPPLPGMEEFVSTNPPHDLKTRLEMDVACHRHDQDTFGITLFLLVAGIFVTLAVLIHLF